MSGPCSLQISNFRNETFMLRNVSYSKTTFHSSLVMFSY